MEMSFEFCALRFFIQWEREEKELNKGMTETPSIAVLRRSLNHFQIARNFPGLKEDIEVQSIAGALICVESGNSSAQEKVVKLAGCFQKKFKRFNLSAASKLLWLRHREPYIIYDSRAVTTLYNFGYRFNTRNYHEYCEAWRKQYGINKKGIELASSKLLTIRGFLPSGNEEENAMSTHISQPWFLERVFDIYLWECAQN